MRRLLKNLERVLTTVLMVMMAIVVVVSVVDLGRSLVRDMLQPPAVLSVDELLELFGMFLLVLIGLELLETLKAHVHGPEVRAEVILLVAIIALARKIVTLDVKQVPTGALLGIGATMVALGVTFYIVRRAPQREPPGHPGDA
jgi:uncharacterized membrane protein (DUF373 family)